MAITLSHGGSSIYSSPSPSSQVLVGTIEGVASIERDGGEWRVAHRSLTDKHVHALVIEPDSGTIFAGANPVRCLPAPMVAKPGSSGTTG